MCRAFLCVACVALLRTLIASYLTVLNPMRTSTNYLPTYTSPKANLQPHPTTPLNTPPPPINQSRNPPSVKSTVRCPVRENPSKKTSP